MMILGIDVSKAKVDVALFNDKEFIASGEFANTATGFKKLSQWIENKDAKKVWACMESTGRYGDALATYLYEQDHQVSVVNPARIKKYGESQLKRNKTDKLDARTIADFCRTQEPALWTPLSPEQRELQEMVRRLSVLIQDQTRERNRLKSGVESEVVKTSITDTLDFLARQIDQLEALIQDHVDRHPDLKQNQELLTSISGIGNKTAFKILGELPDVRRFDKSGEVVAYAGLSPQQHTSGSSVRKKTRLTKTGNQNIKTALYFPALSAIKHNPVVKALADRLKEKGKEKMVIVGAAMRKLMQLIYGILKSRQPFDPDYSANLQNTA